MRSTFLLINEVHDHIASPGGNGNGYVKQAKLVLQIWLAMLVVMWT